MQGQGLVVVIDKGKEETIPDFAWVSSAGGDVWVSSVSGDYWVSTV